jgi:hypothetical protein
MKDLKISKYHLRTDIPSNQIQFLRSNNRRLLQYGADFQGNLTVDIICDFHVKASLCDRPTYCTVQDDALLRTVIQHLRTERISKIVWM